MDPINQKERTTAFLQFIVLFVITIVFVNVGVFFNTRFFRKDYQVLKEKLKEKEGSTEFIPPLVSLLDSTKQSIKTLDVTNDADFDAVKTDIYYKFLDQLRIASIDTSNVDLLRASMRDICHEWINDRRKLLQVNELLKENARQDRRIQKLEQILIQKGVSEDVLKNIGE
ncbi:MAG: hypothetical protein IPP71_09445 [Bacteroidetes bacterium]|nr:hypothetical protein [Bacteroidota bacterium]